MKYNDHNYNYVRNRKNRARARLENSELAIKINAERKQEHEEKYGKYPNYILMGEKDRIKGIPPQIVEDENKQISYYYGYYEKGSRVLEGLFADGVYTQEEQRIFGITDLINGLPEKNIAGLKKYKAYMDGRVYQKGRESYDFIKENNLSFEEYVHMMEILFPEVLEPIFREGYNSKTIEEDKNSKKR